MFHPAALDGMTKRSHGPETGRPAGNRPQETTGGAAASRRLDNDGSGKLSNRAAATRDFQGYLGTRLKQPPVKLARRRLIHPVRLKPLQHILMTGDGDQLPTALAYRFGHGGRADLGHRAIDHAGKFVNDRQLRAFGQHQATLTRNCSPVNSTPNGRNQLGGLLKPTDDSRPLISLIPIAAGKASRIDCSAGHSCRSHRCGGRTVPGRWCFCRSRWDRRSDRRSTDALRWADALPSGKSCPRLVAGRTCPAFAARGRK